MKLRKSYFKGEKSVLIVDMMKYHKMVNALEIKDVFVYSTTYSYLGCCSYYLY